MTRHMGFVLVLSLATTAGAATQDIASATAKAPKETGHVAKKTSEVTAHGAEAGVKKTGETTGHAVVGTTKGVRKGANRLGNGIKKAATADTSK